MEKQRIKDLAHLVDKDHHQLAYFLAAQYTEQQIAGVVIFRAAAFRKAPSCRQEAVDLFVLLVPGRGESDLLALFRAMRADGYDGPFFTRVLGG